MYLKLISLTLVFLHCYILPGIKSLSCARELLTNHGKQFVEIQVCPHFTVSWKKKDKQLLARRVTSIRYWLEEKQHASILFTPLSKRKSATLSFQSNEWGRNYVKLFVLYQNEIFIGSEHLPGTDDRPGCFIFSDSYLASTSAKAKARPGGFQWFREVR